MGQGTSTPYVRMLKHSLAVYGITVASTDIEMCLKVVREWNPWFPEEGTLDMDNWRRVRHNVKKAMRQGEKIPVRFWSIWSIIFTVLKAMEDDRTVENFQKEMAPSIQDLPLDTDEKRAVEKDTFKLALSREPSECDNDESKTKVKSDPETEHLWKVFQRVMTMAGESKKSSKKPSAPSLSPALAYSPKNPFLSAALAGLDALRDSDDESETDKSVFAFPVIRPPPVQGVAQAPYYEGIGIEDIGRLKKAVSLYGPQSHYVKELVNGLARHYNNFSPEDWRVLCRALLREPEYLQWQMWFSELCMDRARQNALNPNPQGQAIVERAHSTLKLQIKKLKRRKKDHILSFTQSNARSILLQALFTLNFLNLPQGDILSRAEKQFIEGEAAPLPLNEYIWFKPVADAEWHPGLLLCRGKGYAYVSTEDGRTRSWLPARWIRSRTNSNGTISRQTTNGESGTG
uniref:endogenous retrovirus group K member 19 Gag polyprotein-like n=1 Tax=Halichoerus grypus TaxID=9711 RepID=UPI001658C8E7|nr:endogenous retrovirus group K member 19 Gag polyprotein-like [Halichoerus grypus]